MVAVPCAWLAVRFIRWRRAWLVVTSYRIVDQWGAASGNRIEIPLDSIEQVRVDQGMVRRILGTGSIDVVVWDQGVLHRIEDARKPVVLARIITRRLGRGPHAPDTRGVGLSPRTPGGSAVPVHPPRPLSPTPASPPVPARLPRPRPSARAPPPAAARRRSSTPPVGSPAGRGPPGLPRSAPSLRPRPRAPRHPARPCGPGGRPLLARSSGDRPVDRFDAPCGASDGGRVERPGFSQNHHASTEARTGDPRAVDARPGPQRCHQRVERRGGHVEVPGQAPMARIHLGPGPGQVAPGQRTGERVDPCALGHHVADPPPEHGVPQPGHVLGPRRSQWPDDGGGRLALGHPGGVGRGPQVPPQSRVHDHELGAGRQRDVPGRTGGEVDAQGIAGPAAGAHQGIHQPHGHPDAVLGLAAQPGHHPGVALDAEGVGQRDRQGCARRQPRPPGQRRGDVHGDADGGAGERDERGHQARPRGLHDRQGVGVGHQGQVGTFAGVGVRGHGDPVVTGGHHLHRDPEADGHGQGQPQVVVGVVPDEVHPSRAGSDDRRRHGVRVHGTPRLGRRNGCPTARNATVRTGRRADGLRDDLRCVLRD